MGETKRRFEFFSFYDRARIEAHLESMAQKGWMIENVGFLWRYRRCEPKRVRFCVTYYPRASVFDPEPTEGELDFQDFCARTGWELAASNAQLQIFVNRSPDPVPIDTDPALELERIDEAYRRGYLPQLLFGGVLSLINMWLITGTVATDPVRLLSEPVSFSSAFGWIGVWLLITVELATYYTWRRKARRAAERGEFLLTRGTGRTARIAAAMLLLALAFWLFNIFAEGDRIMRLIMGVMLGFMAFTIVLTRLNLGLLKRLKVKRGLSRILAYAVPTVVGTVIVSAAIFMMIPHLAALGSSEDLERYAQRGQVYYLYRNQVPLGVSDLTGADPADYIDAVTGGESVFLGRIEVKSRPGFGAEDRENMPRLEYQLVSVKMGFLKDLAVRLMVPRYSDGHMQDWVLEPVDPAGWAADSAYRLFDRATGQFCDRYVICGGDRVAELSFSWEPTPAQMRAAGERLLTVPAADGR